MLRTMNKAAKRIVVASISFVLTIISLFLVTTWDFRPIDVAVLFLFLVGVGVGTQVRGRHFPAIVVHIADEGINCVVLTIFTDQIERGAASSTRRESSVGYSAEMTPGARHYVEDCHRTDKE
jgi:hypothetical protein